jgi:rhodanese-related sulfurtransferase
MSTSLIDWYKSVSRMHVESYEKLVHEKNVIADIVQNNVPKDYAIVLLCPDGQCSMKLYKELEKLAYTNVYVVDGGYQQLVTERSEI